MKRGRLRFGSCSLWPVRRIAAAVEPGDEGLRFAGFDDAVPRVSCALDELPWSFITLAPPALSRSTDRVRVGNILRPA